VYFSRRSTIIQLSPQLTKLREQLSKAWQKLPHGAVIANSSLLSFFFKFTVNVIRQMAPLFTKIDSNKLWHDVQHEENVICAQFGNDLFNISKVIGRKKWPSFLTHSV